MSIRIAYFITSLQVGGSENQLISLCEGLPNSQYEKHIICLAGLGPLEQRARAAGVVVHDLAYPRLRKDGKVQWRNIPKAAGTLRRLRRTLQIIKPDVLHTLIPVCNIMGAMVARRANVPRMVCSRLSLGVYRDTKKLVARLEDWTDKRFDLFHCKSQAIMEDMLQREPVSREKLRVVYNGIDVSRFSEAVNREAIRRELGLRESAFVAIMVANLHSYKGHLDALNAAKLLMDRTQEDYQLLFVGRDDGMGGAVAEFIKAGNLQEKIVVAGERRDVPRLLCAMDALISASHEEGFSNVILEGMAAGLPVIATRIGGNLEQVEHRRTGLLVEPRSPEELAAALRELIENRAQAKKWGVAGRERVNRLFSREAMIQGMRALYAELFKQP